MISNKIKNLSKFCNLLIKKGHKSFASKTIFKTLFLLKKKTKKNPVNILSTSIKTLTPGISTKKTLVAGRLYNLPCSITNNKALYFGCTWLQKSAVSTKDGKKIYDLSNKLANETLKVLKKTGNSMTLLKQHNKLARDNRPFLRFVRKKRSFKKFKFRKFQRKPNFDTEFEDPDYEYDSMMKLREYDYEESIIEQNFQNKINKRFSFVDKKNDSIKTTNKKN